MRRVPAPVIATAAVGVCWLMLDSGAFRPGSGPALLSFPLGVVAFVFGVGAWAMRAGGQPERVPLLAGLSVGLGGYALGRLLFV